MAQIGDLVPKSGVYTQPGVIVERTDDGNVIVDTEPMAVSKYHRFTNTSGLTEPEKNEFNSILDQIYTKQDGTARINDIQTEIDRLKTDPKSRNIVQYLRNQQSFLIRDARKLPQVYQTDEMMLKK
jgi:hypothetical protein